MIFRSETIQNNTISISYNYHSQGVIVQNLEFSKQRIFGGYPWLLDRYRELAENFSEQITFDDACNYFTLNEKESETYQPK